MDEQTENPEHIVSREQKAVANARLELVSGIVERTKDNERHWAYAFKRMRDDRAFVRGRQWPRGEVNPLRAPYVANVTLRHILQRTAATYARNPTAEFKRRKRLNYKLWDGNPSSLEQAQMTMQAAAQPEMAMAAGMPPPSPEQVQQAQQLIMEVSTVKQMERTLDKTGETLKLLYEYFIYEQSVPFKTQMKQKYVRRAHTIGVAYVRPDYQRAMERSPEVQQKISDASRRLQAIERMSADVADGEVEEDSAEAERLRLLIEDLSKEEMVVVREGLTFDFPDPTCIIPDTGLISLQGFEGCEEVAEKYLLTPERVQEVYGIDVGKKAETYRKEKPMATGAVEGSSAAREETDATFVAVYEVWNRTDGTVCTVCDGYDDFLVEPRTPDIYYENFFPWLPYAPNATDDDIDPFPQSDVALMRSQQQEINRAGEGLREHRNAARPGWVSSVAMEEKDRTNLANREAFEVTFLQAAQGRKIEEVLMAFPNPGIDPNLYSTGPAFDDIQRTVGSQEANMGGISGGSATEVSLAESSRQSALTSSRDELDDVLTMLARMSGQILMTECEPAFVKEIVGPGAVWPVQDRESVAKEVFLEVKAGSSGRPNQAQEMQTFERVGPMLMQMPGLDPEMMLKRALKVWDDTLEVSDFVKPGVPSITAMNGMAQAEARAPAGAAPEQQGPQGASNAPQPPGRPGGGMPRNEQGG